VASWKSASTPGSSCPLGVETAGAGTASTTAASTGSVLPWGGSVEGSAAVCALAPVAQAAVAKDKARKTLQSEEARMGRFLPSPAGNRIAKWAISSCSHPESSVRGSQILLPRRRHPHGLLHG
jgi:hypothetical protein